jgi:hypothetical protein
MRGVSDNLRWFLVFSAVWYFLSLVGKPLHIENQAAARHAALGSGELSGRLVGISPRLPWLRL